MFIGMFSGFRWIILGPILCLLFLFLICNQGVEGISCYKCSSRNGSNPTCHDPYHPAYSNFEEDCKVAKENHIGVFPAHFCVKIIGKSRDTDETLLIRTCVLENMDSQCGVFKFGEEIMHGCILSCDMAGCNSSNKRKTLSVAFILPLILAYM